MASPSAPGDAGPPGPSGAVPAEPGVGDAPSLPSAPPPRAPRPTSSVESIVDALVDEASLSRTRDSQQQTLAQLDDAAARIAAMTKQTADGYARNAAEFVRAARAAKAVQRDLESATRRIAALRERLERARADGAAAAAAAAPAAPRSELAQAPTPEPAATPEVEAAFDSPPP